MSYFHLNANTTGTLIQKGTTGLVRLVVGKAGSADWTVTIYDGVDNTGNVISVNNLNGGGQYDYEIELAKGLFVTAAFSGSGNVTGDVTIVYG